MMNNDDSELRAHLLAMINGGADAGEVRSFLQQKQEQKATALVDVAPSSVPSANPTPSLKRPSNPSQIAPLPLRRISTYNHPLLDRESATLVLFAELMKRRQVSPAPPSCLTPLSSATRPDVVKVAKGIVSLVMSNASEETAVARCLEEYPLLSALNNANPDYFEELLVLTSVRIMKDSRRYAQVRLFVGAALSTFDTATDIYMTVEF